MDGVGGTPQRVWQLPARRTAAGVDVPALPVALQTPRPSVLPPVFIADVERVHDGDTIVANLHLSYGGLVAHGRRLRLIGCNAAETKTAGGDAAAAYLAGLLPRGTLLSVGVVSETADPHGRPLVTAALPDGTDLVEQLIALQWAARWDGRGPAPVPPWPRTVSP